ncbi:CNNM domain-containing protein [Shewanella surugensis]|uniref:CNNM domain-containing protein n=1 Tax=Shewanella surugensis TaxID=212020 RepID=A0ABT0LBD4_9GAMM|nr:CNNM domain-containing protein [Shewanella surugensis]MCL1125013.1 CNNM domain-containing protein [Shewanella surugensis]
MLTLVIIVLLALTVSFICSIFEAVLLSVTNSYITTLSQSDAVSAARLKKQRNNIESPLVSILTLNTMSHTVGAAVAGAQASKIFGDQMFGVFSAVLTFLILFLSEIIPKTLGANHWRRLAPLTSLFILWMEKTTLPLIWLSSRATQLLGKGDQGLYIRQEISSMAQIGKESGELDEQESHILIQMLNVKEMPVTTIMTPRTVVFKLPMSMTLKDFTYQHLHSPFSRIPIYDKDPDDIIGFINRHDAINAANTTPAEYVAILKQSLLIVPETAKILPLFQLMIKRSTKIAMVVDEYGCDLGIITLEDIVESLLGLEIVDSNDPAADMQQLARQLWQKRIQQKGIRISGQ